MSITIRQLETLARHFHFDMDEARAVIGIELKTKRTTTPKTKMTKKDSDYISGHVTIKEKRTPAKPKKTASTSPRGPSGYNLFVREQGISFKNAGQAWKALTDTERQRWNQKAKA